MTDTNPPKTYPDAASVSLWTDAGVSSLCPGDIILVRDRPSSVDTDVPREKGSFVQLPKIAGVLKRGERVTVGRVEEPGAVFPSFKSRVDVQLHSGFQKRIYFTVLWSAGTEPMPVDALRQFMQHHTNTKTRTVQRQRGSGPRPEDRAVSLQPFEEMAARQRANIDEWMPLRLQLEAMAPIAGKKRARDFLLDHAPDEVLDVEGDDYRPSEIWASRIWSGVVPIREAQCEGGDLHDLLTADASRFDGRIGNIAEWVDLRDAVVAACKAYPFEITPECFIVQTLGYSQETDAFVRNLLAGLVPLPLFVREELEAETHRILNPAKRAA